MILYLLGAWLKARTQESNMIGRSWCHYSQRFHIRSFLIILTPSLSHTSWSPRYPIPQIQPCNANHEIPFSTISCYALTHFIIPSQLLLVQCTINSRETKKQKINSPRYIQNSRPLAPLYFHAPVFCGSGSSPTDKIPFSHRSSDGGNSTPSTCRNHTKQTGKVTLVKI